MDDEHNLSQFNYKQTVHSASQSTNLTAIQVVQNIFYPNTFEESFHFLAMLGIIKENIKNGEYIQLLCYLDIKFASP